MLRSIHSTRCLKPSAKHLQPSTRPHTRNFHPSPIRRNGPLEIVELCHTYVSYVVAIPLIAATPHAFRYFFFDRPAVRDELQRGHTARPIARAWLARAEKPSTEASMVKGRSSQEEVKQKSDADVELAEFHADRLEEKYGRSSHRHVGSLFIRTSLHMSYTIWSVIQLRSPHVSASLVREYWDLNNRFNHHAALLWLSPEGSAQQVDGTAPTIEQIEAAIDAFYFDSLDQSTLVVLVALLGWISLRRSTFWTSMRLQDIERYSWFRLLYLAPGLQRCDVYAVQKDNGIKLHLPNWLALYESTISKYERLLQDTSHIVSLHRPKAAFKFLSKQDLNNVPAEITLALLLVGAPTVVLGATLIPAQLLYLLGCGLAAWLRGRSLEQYRLSQMKRSAERDRTWQLRVPADNNPSFNVPKRSKL